MGPLAHCAAQSGRPKGLSTLRESDTLPLKSPRARREARPGRVPGDAEYDRSRAFE